MRSCCFSNSSPEAYVDAGRSCNRPIVTLHKRYDCSYLGDYTNWVKNIKTRAFAVQILEVHSLQQGEDQWFSPRIRSRSRMHFQSYGSFRTVTTVLTQIPLQTIARRIQCLPFWKKLLMLSHEYIDIPSHPAQYLMCFTCVVRASICRNLPRQLNFAGAIIEIIHAPVSAENKKLLRGEVDPYPDPYPCCDLQL